MRPLAPRRNVSSDAKNDFNGDATSDLKNQARFRRSGKMRLVK